MISRREFLGTSLAASASLALTPELLRAFEQSGGKLIQRAIPSSGEMLPAIGFAPRPGDPAAIKDVLKTLLDNGGKVVDVLHAGPQVELAARAAANELGIQNTFRSLGRHPGPLRRRVQVGGRIRRDLPPRGGQSDREAGQQP